MQKLLIYVKPNSDAASIVYSTVLTAMLSQGLAYVIIGLMYNDLS